MKKKAAAIVSALIILFILFAAGFIFVLKPGFKYLSERIKIQEYMNSGNYKEAVNYIDTLLKKHPESVSLYKKKGYALILDGRNEEAIEVLTAARNIDSSDAQIHDNISWAYNNLEQYGKALTNSSEALWRNPDLDSAWVNNGNAFFGLFKYEDAIESYDKAIRLNPDYADAYYSRGLAYYYINKFDEALRDFNKYIMYYPNDEETSQNIGECLYYTGKYDEAIAKFDAIIEKNPDYIYSHLYKGYSLEQLDKYEEAVKVYEGVIQIDPKYFSGYLYRGEALYYLGKYKEALDDFNKTIEMDNTNSDAYTWVAKYYVDVKDYNKAAEYGAKAIKLDKENSFAYTTMANIYYKQYKYDEAMGYAEKALSADEGYEDAYTAKSSILYGQERYSECLEFTNKALEKFPNSSELMWYRADSNLYLGYYEKTLLDYEAVLMDYPENEELLGSLGWSHFYLQNYDKSMEYAGKVLKINSKSKDAQMLKKALEKAKLPEAQRIVDFVKNNYFYISQVKDFDVKSKAFLKIKDPTYKDIQNYLQSIKLDSDKFTFFIYGSDYRYVMDHESENHIESKTLKPDIYYVRFTDFTPNIGSEFIKYVDSINNPREKTLVIDLRNNSGGVISAANEMLDYLLPKSTIGSLVFRNGSREPFYSEPDQVRLKKVIIMVNENSASSSEYLTLSLKKHLNNVVVIGHHTFGKGVGQATFEDKKKGYLILLTNFIWDVKGQNIVGSRIKPDINVNGNDDADYFDEAYKQAGK